MDPDSSRPYFLLKVIRAVGIRVIYNQYFKIISIFSDPYSLKYTDSRIKGLRDLWGKLYPSRSGNCGVQESSRLCRKPQKP